MSPTTTWTFRWAAPAASTQSNSTSTSRRCRRAPRCSRMRALDVDEEQGEVDLVYINGHLLGKLTGANNVWSVTAFNVNPAWLVAGPESRAHRRRHQRRRHGLGHDDRLGTASDRRRRRHRWRHAAACRSPALRWTPATSPSILRPRCTRSPGGNYRLQITLIDPTGNAVTVLIAGLQRRCGRGRHAHGEPGLSALERLGHVHHPGAAFLARSGARQFPRAAGHRHRAVHAHGQRRREQLQQRQRR